MNYLDLEVKLLSESLETLNNYFNHPEQFELLVQDWADLGRFEVARTLAWSMFYKQQQYFEEPSELPKKGWTDSVIKKHSPKAYALE